MSVSKAKCCYKAGGGLRGTNSGIMRRKLLGNISVVIRLVYSWAKKRVSRSCNFGFWVNCQKSFYLANDESAICFCVCGCNACVVQHLFIDFTFGKLV